MNRKSVITLVTLVVIALGAAVATFLVKGYTFSPKEGRVVGTGIIYATSIPDGAAVYVDGHLATATDATIPSLSPNTYSIRISKEGFIDWEKKIEVREGIVTEIKATLFPAIPTLFPLTYNGISGPVLSPDGQKLAFGTPLSIDLHSRQKGGVWVWNMTSQPISFTRGAEPRQIAISSESIDFSKGEIRWSSDSKELLVTLQEGGLEVTESQRNFLLPVDQTTSIGNLRDITPSLDVTFRSWEEDQRVKDDARIQSIKDLKLRDIASSSAVLKWSPDETKFMTATLKNPTPNISPIRQGALSPTPKIADTEPGLELQDVKVYEFRDTKGADKLTFNEYTLPEARSYIWLPDSEHIILVSDDKISISEFDGSNVGVLYAGAFQAATVFPWPDSSRLVFVTSFNTPTASTPNLFGINLK